MNENLMREVIAAARDLARVSFPTHEHDYTTEERRLRDALADLDAAVGARRRFAEEKAARR